MSPDGLSHVEAAKRPTRYGPNELEEEKTNPVLKCLIWETVSDDLGVEGRGAFYETAGNLMPGRAQA